MVLYTSTRRHMCMDTPTIHSWERWGNRVYSEGRSQELKTNECKLTVYKSPSPDRNVLSSKVKYQAFSLMDFTTSYPPFTPPSLGNILNHVASLPTDKIPSSYDNAVSQGSSTLDRAQTPVLGSNIKYQYLTDMTSKADTPTNYLPLLSSSAGNIMNHIEQNVQSFADSAYEEVFMFELERILDIGKSSRPDDLNSILSCDDHSMWWWWRWWWIYAIDASILTCTQHVLNI